MTDTKKPEDFFPLSEDDLIISDHAQGLIDQERKLIQEINPMKKAQEAYVQKARHSDFWNRLNGAGQFSLYRPEGLSEMVHILMSVRVLSPALGEAEEPTLSLRFSLQVGETRFRFARVVALKDDKGRTACCICAVQSDDLSSYYIQTEDDQAVHINFDESIPPLTEDDLASAVTLNKEDLVAALNLAMRMPHCDEDTRLELLFLKASILEIDI